MNISKGIILTAAASALVIGTSAFSADEAKVEGKKEVAPLQTVLPNSYGKLEVRHETDRTMTEDKVNNDTPNLSIRPRLGSTFFDGKLNSYFVWIFQKNSDQTAFKKTSLYNESTLDVFSNDLVSLSIYSYANQSNGDNFGIWQVGPSIGNSNSFDLAAGKLGLSVYSMVNPIFTSGQGTSKVTARDATDRGDGFYETGGES